MRCAHDGNRSPVAPGVDKCHECGVIVDAQDPAYGSATAGNNRRVHLIRRTVTDGFVTMCGALTPRRPQTTQEQLPKCKRCFG